MFNIVIIGLSKANKKKKKKKKKKKQLKKKKKKLKHYNNFTGRDEVLANQNSSTIIFYTKQSLPCRSETALSLSSGPT